MYDEKFLKIVRVIKQWNDNICPKCDEELEDQGSFSQSSYYCPKCDIGIFDDDYLNKIDDIIYPGVE